MMAWVVLLLAGAPEARADEGDEEKAKALFVEGLRFYEEARYEESVQALQLAYALSGRAQLLYNVASPLERLGRWAETKDALEKYRPHAKPDEIEAIDRRIAAAQRKLEEEEAARQALLDLQQRGEAPSVTRSGAPVPAYVLLGVGAVGVGSGVAFTARALSARGQWTDLCTEPRLCPVEAQPFVDRDRTASWIADASWVVGVGAVGGGVLWALKGKKSADVAVVPALNGVRVDGVFR